MTDKPYDTSWTMILDYLAQVDSLSSITKYPTLILL